MRRVSSTAHLGHAGSCRMRGVAEGSDWRHARAWHPARPDPKRTRIKLMSQLRKGRFSNALRCSNFLGGRFVKGRGLRGGGGLLCCLA